MTSIEMKMQLAEVRFRLKNAKEKLSNTKTPLAQIATQMYRGVMLNFKEEGTGEKPWKITKRKIKNPAAKILQLHGLLRNSIMPQSDEKMAVVSTNLSYAKPNQKTRKFILIRRETREAVLNVARRWIRASTSTQGEGEPL